MSNINKFKNAWISNDTGLTGGVSLINSGKSIFKDTVSIGLTGATGQQLTVNGDINYTGNLLKNGTVDTVSISGTNNFTGQNTFTTQSPNDKTTKVATTAFISRMLYYNQTTHNLAINEEQYLPSHTGGNNLLFGFDTGKALTSGSNNVALGVTSLRACTSGMQNFVLGTGSLYSLTTGNYNIAIGVLCLSNSNGSNNIGIGTSCAGVSQGNDNTYIGYYTAPSASLDGGNTGIGRGAFTNLTTGQYCTAVGGFSGNIVTTGNFNTFIGWDTKLSSGALTFATAIGAGTIATASNGIFLGRSTETTYCVGGLNIPSGTVMTLLGNISANSLTVTPTQLSFLSNVSTGKIASSLISDIADFLTTASASTLYQPVGSYLTSASLSGYLLSSTASTTYQPIGSYLTSESLSGYLLSSTASSTYQAISGMSSYLLSSAASATYQTISGMASYVTTASFLDSGSYISSTYQTISGMSDYLTSTLASTLYQPIFKSSGVILSDTTITNLNTIYTFCHLSNAAITVTLPTGLSPSNAPVLSFRRIGGIPNSNTNTILNAVVGNQPIYSYNSNSIPIINTTYQLCSSLNIYIELQLIIISPFNSGGGNCNITNGSATINVTSVVSGVRLCVGTSITVRNNSTNALFTKTIISITSGTGGIGAYVMDSTYNFTQTGTSMIINTSYGWAINRLT